MVSGPKGRKITMTSKRSLRLLKIPVESSEVAEVDLPSPFCKLETIGPSTLSNRCDYRLERPLASVFVRKINLDRVEWSFQSVFFVRHQNRIKNTMDVAIPIRSFILGRFLLFVAQSRAWRMSFL